MSQSSNASAPWKELADAVARAKGSNPLEPLTIVTPGLHSARDVLNFVGRHSPASEGLVNIHVMPLGQWARKLTGVLPEFLDRSEATALHREGAIRSVLEKDPGVFSALKNSPRTIQAIGKSIQVLEGIAISPAARQVSALTTDVIRIHEEVSVLLKARFFTLSEVFEAARVVLHTPGKSVGNVIVFLPEKPEHPSEQAFLTALTERDSTTIITRSGEDSVSATDALSHARIIRAADPEEESRAVARIVASAISDGTPGHRIAVAYTAEDPYRVLVHRALDDAGIAIAGGAPRQLSDHAMSRHLLELLSVPEDVRLSPVIVLNALASRSLVWAGRGLPHPNKLEDVYRKLRFSADNSSAEDEVGGDNADQIKTRKQFLAYLSGLESEIRAVQGAPTWEGVVQELSGFLERNFLPNAQLSRIRDLHGTSLKEWFDELSELPAQLKSLEGIAPAPTAESVVSELDHLISRSRKTRNRLGHGVSVAPLQDCGARDVDLLIVCGLAEGFAPPRFAPDPLLPEEFLSALDQGLPTSVERTARRKQQFFTALQSSNDQIVLTIPRGDLRGAGERVPSRWLASRFDTSGTLLDAVDVRSMRDGFASGVPGFSSKETTSRELAIRQGLSVGKISFPSSVRTTTATDFEQALTLIGDRLDRRFTRFNGNLSSAKELGLLPERPISPSSLERYASWPLSFFFVDILEAYPLDDLVLSSEMDSLHRGNLLHKVLERFVLETPQEPDALDPLALERLLEEEARELKKTYGAFWIDVFFERAVADLVTELAEWFEVHEARLKSGYTFVGAERDFGRSGMKADPRYPSVKVELDDGSTFSFRGQIDRIDSRPGGGQEIIDYKSGNIAYLEKIAKNPPTLNKTKFQLVIYGLFALWMSPRESGQAAPTASYWFTKASGARDSSGAPHCFVSITLDEETVRQAESDIRELATLIQGGYFPPSAPESGFDRYTDLQGKETVTDMWDGIKKDPALAPFLAVFGPAEEVEGS